MIVIDKLIVEEAKTKNIANILKSLKVHGSTLLVADGSDPAIFKAARNLDGVKLIPSFKLNSLDLLLKHKVIMTLEAVRNAEKIWGTPFERKKDSLGEPIIDEDIN